ncbi:hypothetical protein MRX96_047347 [Rhipicephalus microplus]
MESSRIRDETGVNAVRDMRNDRDRRVASPIEMDLETASEVSRWLPTASSGDTRARARLYHSTKFNAGFGLRRVERSLRGVQSSNANTLHNGIYNADYNSSTAVNDHHYGG